MAPGGKRHFDFGHRCRVEARAETGEQRQDLRAPDWPSPRRRCGCPASRGRSEDSCRARLRDRRRGRGPRVVGWRRSRGCAAVAIGGFPQTEVDGHQRWLASPAMETGRAGHLAAVEMRWMSGLGEPRIHRGLSALAWWENPNRTAGKDSGASSVTLTVGPVRPRPKKPAPSLLQGVRDLPVETASGSQPDVPSRMTRFEPGDAHRHVRLWAGVI